MSCQEKVVEIPLNKLEIEENPTAADIVRGKDDSYFIIRQTVSEVEHDRNQTDTSTVTTNYVSHQPDAFIVPAPAKDKSKKNPEHPDKKDARKYKKDIKVETMHISCKSDTYQPGHNYGGIMIYQYDGKSEWRTENNTHCETGYIVIQDTDSENVKQWIGKEPGKVHGAVYKNAFGEAVKAEVVGEGFSIQNGIFSIFDKFEKKSGVFNSPKNSEYHDNNPDMHKVSEHCVRKIVKYWKSAGPSWVRQRNFEVEELMKDFDKKKWSCNIL
ncbi:Hypothetical predicted protein [Paramuricea clavata]|uniref:Uncharacterized protein n=1 Tax=Paramuricea clavata TaxID=317549 RepID=A0A6S7LH97_PARCT|nr:Hypothetical predicted protein [Paramuricea clavata]